MSAHRQEQQMEPLSAVISSGPVIHTTFTPTPSRVSFELEETIAMQLASDIRGDRMCAVACSLASCLVVHGNGMEKLVLPAEFISEHVHSLSIHLKHLPQDFTVEVGNPRRVESAVSHLSLPLTAGGRWLGACKYALEEQHIPSTLPNLRRFTNKLAQWLTHFLKQTFEESWEKHMLEIKEQCSPTGSPCCPEIKTIC